VCHPEKRAAFINTNESCIEKRAALRRELQPPLVESFTCATFRRVLQPSLLNTALLQPSLEYSLPSVEPPSYSRRGLH